MADLVCGYCGKEIIGDDYVSLDNGSPAHRECAATEELYQTEKQKSKE